jgi:hypothetical protein
MVDRIEKAMELKAPVSRVWRALTDHQEFGKWFRVRLEGPFVPGRVSRGQITYPGYEHLRWEAVVQKWSLSDYFRSPGIHTPSIPSKTIPESRRRLSSLPWREQQRGRCCASSSPASTSCQATGATRRFV